MNVERFPSTSLRMGATHILVDADKLLTRSIEADRPMRVRRRGSFGLLPFGRLPDEQLIRWSRASAGGCLV